MHRETLRFDNPRTVTQLYNNDLKNLHALEQELGVKVTTREDWLQLEGSKEDVGRARELFQLLHTALVSGSTIRNREFHQAVQTIKNDGIETLQGLFAERITTSSKKSSVTPKTPSQKRYIETIRDSVLTFGIGPAGTGKTYLAMAMAVAALRDGAITRIILTRPAVEAGEALGFLPGDLKEKLAPYLRPLHDALHDMLPIDEIEKHMERSTIEIAPLAYMRGRTLNNAFIILDEAQNATTEQMFMFLTRLGHNSKAVVTGDETQTDLPRHKTSGLVEAHRVLRGIEGIGIIEFSKRDVVRHPLVQKIIAAYETHRARQPETP